MALGDFLPALTYLDAIVQDDTLAREFLDALQPEALFRMDAVPELWAAGIGDTQIITRQALMAVDTEPLVAGRDPVPVSPSMEQWSITCAQYGHTIDTHMPADYMAIPGLFLRNGASLGAHAGMKLNRIARRFLFRAYTGGDTITTALGSASTTVSVVSINGFTTTVVNGQQVPVSTSAPLLATISGVSGSVTITAATPTDSAEPFGPGTLTLLVAATWAADARVKAANAPTIIRSGGASTIDALTTGSVLRMSDIRAAAALMSRNRVPKHSDGYYHCHIDPLGVSQIFGDNEFQRMHDGLPDDLRYSKFLVGNKFGILFFTNTEAPNDLNSGDLIASRASAARTSELLAEAQNKTGVSILRTIITGGGAMMEKYVPEAAYMTAGGTAGKIGTFAVSAAGMSADLDRVRYMIRAPMDRLMQQVAQSWSATLAFGIPSDLGGGLTGSRYKRAVVIESGSTNAS